MPSVMLTRVPRLASRVSRPAPRAPRPAQGIPDKNQLGPDRESVLLPRPSDTSRASFARESRTLVNRPASFTQSAFAEGPMKPTLQKWMPAAVAAVGVVALLFACRTSNPGVKTAVTNDAAQKVFV